MKATFAQFLASRSMRFATPAGVRFTAYLKEVGGVYGLRVSKRGHVFWKYRIVSRATVEGWIEELEVV